MRNKLKRLCLTAGLLALSVWFASCGDERESEPAASIQQESAEYDEDIVKTVSAKAMEKLLMADQVDGESDKIVKMCAGCALAMDGKSDHALHVADYEVHFCSETCKGFFALDTEGNIELLHDPKGE